VIDVAAKQKHVGELAKRNKGSRFKRLYRTLCDETWLTEAWRRIRLNKGSKTAGVDGQTRDDVDETLIKRLAAGLRKEEYRPIPVRRVYIPKSKGKLRPLGISTIQDRIVQSALKMLLEPIFEQDFRPCSHGFRPGRSCMTALQDVAFRFPRSTWLIEGDITSCYDAIHHGRLLSLLRRRVQDEKLLRLIYGFLRAGYLEHWYFQRTYSGVPQGNILSPLLACVYLHELDTFVEETLGANRQESAQERTARRSKDRKNLDNRVATLRQWLKGKRRRNGKLVESPLPPEQKEQILQELKALEQERQRLPTLGTRQKIGYVRYADDWLLILQQHSRAEAAEVKARIKDYLKHSLHLDQSEEKTHITHPTDSVCFLGYDLRSAGGRRKGLRLSIPKGAQAALLDRVEKLCRLHYIDEADLILKVNALVRGWMNYYRYATAPQRTFNDVLDKVFRRVCHYLAGKHQTSIPQILKCYAATIQKNGRTRVTLRKWMQGQAVELWLFPPQTQSIYGLRRGVPEIDVAPQLIHEWARGRSREQRMEALEASNYQCQECGTGDNLAVHHVGGLRGYRTPKALVAAGRAKQKAVFCYRCHLRVGHSGSFGHRPKTVRSPSGRAGCR
jgi:group II intron reverse transcriptase/maturase